MALPKLCALCVILLQFQGHCAIQMFMGKNAKQHPAAALVQPSRLQELVNCNRGQTTVPPNNNNKIIEIKRQYNVGSNCATHIPPAVTQSCQPLSTAQPSATVFQPNTNGICTHQNPTSRALQFSSPPVSAPPQLLTGSNLNKQLYQQLWPQKGLQNIPVSLMEPKNQEPSNSPVTLTLATSQPQPQLTIQSQPQLIPNCPPTQSNVPVHISIDSTSTPNLPQSTCVPSVGPPLQQKAAYVVINQTPYQPQQQPLNPVQQQPQLPYPQCPIQNQFPLSEPQFQQGPYQSNNQLMMSAPNQAAKASSLKRLLPLIYNLLKERSESCGCQSNCNCCNKCDQQYNSYGGYITGTPEGPVFNVEEEDDPSVFPGIIRERNVMDLKSENDSGSDEDESNEMDY